jgi:hypothetical protein
MKSRVVIGSVIILMIGFISCQKNDSGLNGSLDLNLYTSVADIIGIQISNITASTEQGVSVERFNGLGPAYIISGDGHFGNFGMPGWGFSEANHLKFGVPHIDNCVTVSVSSSSFPREIVIEYLKGCSNHRHDRSGKVIINLSDTITNAGAVQTIVYQDFYIDTIKVDLNATLKNLGKNFSGNWIIEKKYEQTITKGNEVAVRKNTETQEWISGFETTDKSDNVFYLSGSGSIVINDEAKYAKNITTPLFYDASCEFIKSGVVELTRNGNVTTIDYGDGTCDDKATVTTDGTTEEINLHSHGFKHGGHFYNQCPRFGDKMPGGRHGG